MAVTGWLSEDDERVPAALAEAEGVGRHEAAIRASRGTVGRHGHERRVSEASVRARGRYADVLERLGK